MPRVRNVIYIHIHDMGRFISPYGYAVSTPHMQGFAESGTLLRQAYYCGPTCSPSRAGLLTGVTPHESGMLGLAHRGFTFEPPELNGRVSPPAQAVINAPESVDPEEGPFVTAQGATPSMPESPR